jgi:predicted DNA-binding transcriptional regulator AlpA
MPRPSKPPQTAPVPVNNADDPLLDQNETCAYIGVGRKTIWTWRQAGLFPQAIRLPSGSIRWRRSVLNAWIDARQIPNQTG